MPNRVISNEKVQKSVILDKNLGKNLRKKFRKTWCPKFLKNLTKNWHFFWSAISLGKYQKNWPKDKKIYPILLLHFYLVLFFFHLRKKSKCDFPAFKTRFWSKTGVFKWRISIGRCFFILWCLIIFSLFLHIIAVWS